MSETVNAAFEHVDDREADAVDGDAALLGDEIDQVVGRRDGHPAGVGVLAEGGDDAGARRRDR